MKIGVIISTYNNPIWLEKTLWGYMAQTRLADEIIIADDGSTTETRDMLAKYEDKLPIVHVWHEDNGFRKTEILNKALVAAKADYLIFTDQDCVPRADFIATHEKFAKRGFFLSGGYNKLPEKISTLLTQDDIISQRAFRLAWLRRQGMPWRYKNAKLMQKPRMDAFLNFITPTRATWNGMNSSAFREEILAVNGFDERMRYGGEDRELGERMLNNGMESRQIRYSAVCLHLWHERPYANKADWQKNRAIRDITKATRSTWTIYGIEKGDNLGGKFNVGDKTLKSSAVPHWPSRDFKKPENAE